MNHGLAWFNTFVGLGKTDLLNEGTVWTQYTVSLFYISTVISSTGLIGSMNPSTMAEVAFISVTMLLNVWPPTIPFVVCSPAVRQVVRVAR